MKRKSQTTKLYGEKSSLLSDKTPSNEKITLIEKNETIKTDTKRANVLNTFFSITISNLNKHEYPVSNSVSNDISDPVLKSVLKHIEHPSIKAIENNIFECSYLKKEEMLSEIVNLGALKSCQDTDVPTKMLTSLQTLLPRQFPSFLKLPNVMPISSKARKIQNTITGQ